MSLRMVVLSIAHSSRHVGAANARVGICEYEISARATEACAMALRSRGIQYAVIDAADMRDNAYDDFKAAVVNAMNPLLAVEIHCNSSDNAKANYGEIIHHPSSVLGQRAAECIAGRLGDTLGHSRHMWPFKGAREWSLERDKHEFFFLHRTNSPAVVCEPLFISNDEQATWLKSAGGAETMGLMIGEGIADHFQKEGY